MSDNIQLTRFLDTIRGEGFELRLNWESKRWAGDEGRARHYSVTNGPNDKQPAVRTFVVVDYGPRDGYGLYLESQSSKITDDVGAVIGLAGEEVSLVA